MPNEGDQGRSPKIFPSSHEPERYRGERGGRHPATRFPSFTGLMKKGGEEMVVNNTRGFLEKEPKRDTFFS